MADVYEDVEHFTATNNGVDIHYVAIGPEDGPLVIMIHGFPDFWYSWHNQMEALKETHRVVAVDLRGYNGSDKPEGVENYTLDILTSDIDAVLKDTGRERATIVGHDWGGAIAWSVAMNLPDIVDRLIVLNLPHPKGLSRELANNEAQQRASGYAFNFQQEGSHNAITPQILVGISQANADQTTQQRYLQAFKNSNIESMLNYYKANFPRPGGDFLPEYPQVQAPVLLIHGLNDQALLPGALSGTWEWVDNELTLVTIPGAGHWVQHDAADQVSITMKNWLATRDIKDR